MTSTVWVALIYTGVQFAAYLIGSIPFGYIVAKARRGIDIREHGSGNIGATNVGRVLGRRFFFLVFALDFAKGILPVMVAQWIVQATPNPDVADLIIYLPELVGFAVIVGHIFPLYLGFKGGKGVATTVGVIGWLAPLAVLLGLVAWGLLVLMTRMVSVGSLGFAFVFTFAHFSLSSNAVGRQDIAVSCLVVVIATLIVVRHVGNIGRIFAGTENRINLPWAAG